MFYYDGNRNVSDVLEVDINPECPNHGGGPVVDGEGAPAQGGGA
jgi:hypothetical protein